MQSRVWQQSEIFLTYNFHIRLENFWAVSGNWFVCSGKNFDVRRGQVQIKVIRHNSNWVSPFGNLRFIACLSAPRSLSQTATSFIGILRQGILCVRLSNFLWMCKWFVSSIPASKLTFVTQYTKMLNYDLSKAAILQCFFVTLLKFILLSKRFKVFLNKRSNFRDQ